MPSWILALLIAVMTIAGSGVVSSYVTHRLASTRAEREFRLRKLEEIQSALDNYLVRFSSGSLGMISLGGGFVTDEELKKAQDAWGGSNVAELRTVETLVKIYFPRLRLRINEVVQQQQQQLIQLVAQTVHKGLKGRGSDDSMRECRGAVMTLIRVGDHFREALFEEAQRVQRTGTLASLAEFLRDQLG
ncbi:MAG: hypothetical protein ACREIF_16715 [Chthoniobacterales bacterium]